MYSPSFFLLGRQFSQGALGLGLLKLQCAQRGLEHQVLKRKTTIEVGIATRTLLIGYICSKYETHCLTCCVIAMISWSEGGRGYPLACIACCFLFWSIPLVSSTKLLLPVAEQVRLHLLPSRFEVPSVGNFDPRQCPRWMTSCLHYRFFCQIENSTGVGRGTQYGPSIAQSSDQPRQEHQ